MYFFPCEHVLGQLCASSMKELWLQSQERLGWEQEGVNSPLSAHRPQGAGGSPTA